MSLNKEMKQSLSRNLAGRKRCLLAGVLGILLIGTPFCSSPPSGSESVTIVIDGNLGKPAEFGVNRLLGILEKRGQAVERADSIQGASSSDVLLVGTLSGSSQIKDMRTSGRLDLSDHKESLVVKRLKEGGRNLVVTAGADDTGLMYALLEIAEQVRTSSSPAGWFGSIPEVTESPLVPVRSMAVLLHSEDCEEDWYYSEEYWEEYFAMLAADRWNAFNLIFSHQTPYLSPLYAFHVKVEEHPEVKAKGLTEEQRVRNLEILRFISSLAKQRGLEFTLGIWQQIAWEGKNQGSRQESMVTGLTRKNMHSYTYHALLNLLRECPDIQTIQLRINHESGIDYDEQTEFYKSAVFRAVKDCGRPVKLEARNVGLLRETLQAALDMGLPTRVSHKYWGEHMVFPHHPTRIMWTYSYGDWLKYPQKYENLYQVWSLGSHRLLLWGDPDYVRRFAPTTLFEDASGFEICAPLSQKGYGNPPGAWRIFRDKDREHYRWEFERYWSTYMLFGRLTYNPSEGDEVWMRELRSRFGKVAAPAVGEAYKAASRVLPLIMGTATPDYNMYTWAEKDSGGLINFYLHYGSYDPYRITSFMEYVRDVVESRHSGKRTSEDMALRLEAEASEVERRLQSADSAGIENDKEYWATKKDFQILMGMARFFAQKIRATYKLGLFYETGDLSLLKEAVVHAENALETWKTLSAVAEEIYYPNLVMGPGSVGHWKDNIVFVENDLKQLNDQVDLFKLVGNFDFGFDFGPHAYTDVTEIYTPRYTNYYSIEHRFQGVFPQSYYNPQQGFGWNTEVSPRADRPPKVARTVWRASNIDNLDIPSQALLSDFVYGTEPAVFRIDLPEGHYQATLILTDRNPSASDHGPMNISVIERFGERPILENLIVKKGEMIVKRFNFNMVGSRYSNFRLKLAAGAGADYILNGLIFTRVEPHIAHLPSGKATPGQDLAIRATITLPPPVREAEKASLSIARGTTSTVEPPGTIEQVTLFYSPDGGDTYHSLAMEKVDDSIYAASIPGGSIRLGDLYYYIEAADSIGQVVHAPRISQLGCYHVRVTTDRNPPVFRHTPILAADPGKSLQISAHISDESRVDKVLLYYRPTRQTMEYSVLEMEGTGGNSYKAVIPGEVLTTQFDLIYFFEAIDEFGNGTFYPDPDMENPHIVVKVRR
jgi:hypothetical protein